MSKKFKSHIDLQNALDDDFTTRRNELTIMKNLVVKNEKTNEGFVFSKQLITTLYSHWEGFIKYSSECLIKYTYHLGLRNNEINHGLFAISKLEKIKQFNESGIRLKIYALKEILTDFENKSDIPYNYSIATDSNLRTETLVDICLILGIDEAKYETKIGIIDEKLADKRNDIAHGKLIKISPKESIEIYNLVFPLLEQFKADILDRSLIFKKLKKG